MVGSNEEFIGRKYKGGEVLQKHRRIGIRDRQVELIDSGGTRRFKILYDSERLESELLH